MVEFLVLVEFVAARIACRVEMPDVIYVVAQSSDYVAFSQSHMKCAALMPLIASRNMADPTSTQVVR